MTDKHTDGPWRTQTKKPRRILTGENEQTRLIAKCPVINSLLSAKEQEANARLIAAAPDMLSILECIVAGDDGTGDRLCYINFVKSRIEAKAVIAKAKGLGG